MPTHNQPQRLALTLEAFAVQQQAPPWELIVVDDGSGSETTRVLKHSPRCLPLVVHRQAHSGRAAARNSGLELARAETIVFCDGDRAPGSSFVASHARAHEGHGDVAVVGQILELYYSNFEAEFDGLIRVVQSRPDDLVTRARHPAFVRLVYSMLDGYECRWQGAWLLFLTGNVSAPRRSLVEVGGFDEDFREWGFEHFDLGYRLHTRGLHFRHEPDAVNFHFAHRRPSDFYARALSASARILAEKHPELPVEALLGLVSGRVSLEHFEARLRT